MLAHKRSSVSFLVTLLLVFLFTIFLLENEEPYSLGIFVLLIISNVIGLIAIIYFLATSKFKRKAVLFLLVGTTFALVGAYIFSNGNGYPVSFSDVQSITQICAEKTFTYTNATYSAVSTSYRTVCNAGPSYLDPLVALFTLMQNLFVWALPVGSALYAMPNWNSVETTYSRLGRLLRGSVLSGAILLNLIGIQSAGDVNASISVHSPLNPALAYQLCDSTTALSGCVYMNTAYLLVDYGFWSLVACLFSLVASEFYALATKQKTSVTLKAHPFAKRAIICSGILTVLVVSGLIVVPTVVSQSGVIVQPGNSFSFYSSSLLNIPFDVNHPSKLTGSFASNLPIYLYVLNSTQYNSFVNQGNFCPDSSFTSLSTNSTQTTISTMVETGGGYHLVFCAPQIAETTVQIQITNPIEVQ